MGSIAFVTATDTGAGKTLLTALLLTHLRQHGCHALAVKPFSSGSRRDGLILTRVQEDELQHRDVAPYCFPEPLAPLLAARRAGCRVGVEEVLTHIRALAARCEVLLVEGAGGLYAPLGEGFSAADLIGALRCPVLVAARNKLGVVNHVLLTLVALQKLSVPNVRLVLMQPASEDLAAQTNPGLLRELIAPVPLTVIAYLGRGAEAKGALERAAKKLKKPLAQICETATFSSASGGKMAVQVRKKSTCGVREMR
jgi:dethiobiotin synthetase